MRKVQFLSALSVGGIGEFSVGVGFGDLGEHTCGSVHDFAVSVSVGFGYSCVVELVSCELRDKHSVKVTKACRRQCIGRAEFFSVGLGNFAVGLCRSPVQELEFEL